MSDDIIVITAAGAGTWLRERFTPGGIVRWLGEGLISDYAQKMETLRLIDDRIYEWSKDLNTYVNLMENAFKSKRIVDLASVALVISNTLKKVTLQEQFIKNISEKAISEFEGERGDLSSWWREPTASPALSEEEISSQMKERGIGGKNTKANHSLDLIKEAGWWDDLTRKWVHKKIRSKKIQERDSELQMFFSKTKNIVSRVRNLADKLHALRASGEIGKYLDGLREISKLQNEFENDPKIGFKAIYKKHLKELVEHIIQNNQNNQQSLENTVLDSASSGVKKIVERVKADDPDVDPQSDDSEDDRHKIDYQLQEGSRSCPCGKKNNGIPFVYDLCHGKEKALQKLKQLPGNENKSNEKLESSLFSIINQREKRIAVLEAVLESDQSSKQEKKEAQNKLNEENKNFFDYYKEASMSKIEFITKLSSCSNQYEAANLLLKHSQEIEEYDLNTSLKLLAIAEGLLNE